MRRAAARRAWPARTKPAISSRLLRSGARSGRGQLTERSSPASEVEDIVSVRRPRPTAARARADGSPPRDRGRACRRGRLVSRGGLMMGDREGFGSVPARSPTERSRSCQRRRPWLAGRSRTREAVDECCGEIAWAVAGLLPRHEELRGHRLDRPAGLGLAGTALAATPRAPLGASRGCSRRCSVYPEANLGSDSYPCGHPCSACTRMVWSGVTSAVGLGPCRMAARGPGTFTTRSTASRCCR